MRMSKKLLTPDEAATMAGVKESTIRRWILERKYIDVVKLGKSVRIPIESVERLIADGFRPAKIQSAP